MKRIAIFASGNGTNAEAIARRLQQEAAHSAGAPRIVAVVTDRRQAGVRARMEALGIESVHFPASQWRAGAPDVIALLRSLEVDLIVLAGFLAYVPPAMVKEWEGRIVNIHPSLLPRHGGKGMYGEHVHRAVLAAGDSVSGITIHLVDEQFDHGRILFQAECPVCPGDTPDTLAARIHGLEHEHFPEQVLRLAASLPER